jgi:hypothetical protein
LPPEALLNHIYQKYSWINPCPLPIHNQPQFYLKKVFLVGIFMAKRPQIIKYPATAGYFLQPIGALAPHKHT